MALASAGYHTGFTGSRRSVVGLGMALSFVLVMWLVADLDRQMEGVLRVNHQVMIDLRESMKAEAP